MSKKLHILFLCGWYPSRVLPNNGDFIQRHAEAVRLQHKVSVLHIISDKNCLKKIEFTLEIINGISTHIAYIKPSKNPIVKNIRFYRAFKTLLKKIDYFDVVHLNILYPFGLLALYLKWLKKKPYIISEHWTGYHQFKNTTFFQRNSSRIISKNAKIICPVSNNLGEVMQKIGLIGNYYRVPNVVDVKVFKPASKVVSKFTILHISNMNNTHKNVSGIIKTFARFEKKYPQSQLILLGNDAKKYNSLASKFGINNIQFIQQIPHKEVVNYMQLANVFVLFSNYENLPCVILESFACGTPVISTDVGGIREYFPKNFGVLIEKRNQEMLFKQLEKQYLNRHNQAVKMHTYASKHFSKEVISKEFSKLYKNVFACMI